MSTTTFTYSTFTYLGKKYAGLKQLKGKESEYLEISNNLNFIRPKKSKYNYDEFYNLAKKVGYGNYDVFIRLCDQKQFIPSRSCLAEVIKNY